MKDKELDVLLDSITVPQCSDDLTSNIIMQSHDIEQEKTFRVKIFDMLFSKLTAYAVVPVAACLFIGIFAYTPDDNEIDMMEYAEFFLLEENMDMDME